MSAWRGLTRPEQHRVTSIPDMAYCVVCGDCCWRVEPCRCCLAAEERLTAALAERDRRVEAALRVLDTSQTDIAAEVVALRAQVQRVRELCDRYSRLTAPRAASLLCDLHDALDGGDE